MIEKKTRKQKKTCYVFHIHVLNHQEKKIMKTKNMIQQSET